MTAAPARPRRRRRSPRVEYVACPRCTYPLDPAALPYHPEHDLPPEVLDREERERQAREAAADERQRAIVRAHERQGRAVAAAYSKSSRRRSR